MRISPQNFFKGQNLMKENIGAIGEQTAAVYLIANGAEIVERNWHCRFGELDIVAADAQYLIFAEVKTRAENSLVSGEEAVDLRKQQKLRNAAEMYLQQNPTDLQPRFDVILVEHNERRDFRVVNHLSNAF